MLTEIKRDYFDHLLKVVPKYNRGFRAGKYSKSYSLGTPKKPLRITRKNVLDQLHNLVRGGGEASSHFCFGGNVFTLFVHPHILGMVRKADVYTTSPEDLFYYGPDHVGLLARKPRIHIIREYHVPIIDVKTHASLVFCIMGPTNFYYINPDSVSIAAVYR